MGGAAGLLLAWTGVRALTLSGAEWLPLVKSVSVDAPVLGFTLAAVLVTTLLSGTAPALSASRAALSEGLKDGVRGTGGGPGRTRLRSAFVVSEVALAVLLVIGAALAVAVCCGFRT
jgi:hypothetical protein